MPSIARLRVVAPTHSQQITAVGGMLGRYEVIKHLAQGGMAEVLLGRSSGVQGFERYVVIKRIRWDQARDQQFVKMFLDEARLAAALHHTNILQVHDIGEEGGEYFFTMEYLHGQDLRKLLKRVVAREELVPLEQVATIVIGAAAGLHFAHEHRGPDRQPLGIVHRDVSLSNIMVGYDGFVKVTDFGIAKAAMRSAETRSGVLKGKVAYMSPEQCLGKSVDRRSDVYALGIVLYELATARRLFKSDSDFLTMSAIVDGKIPLPTTLRPDIPPELEAIIMKALARRPANRYQTADELRAALEDFAVQSRMRTSGTALAAYMKKVFGDQPEPWVTDAPVDVPDDSDFDGSASGIVGPLTDALRELALPNDTPAPSAPIMKARTRATTNAPLPIKKELSDAITLRPNDEGATVAEGSAFVDAPPRGRGKWLALGGVLMVASVVAIVIAMRSPKLEAEPSEPKAPVANPEPEQRPATTPERGGSSSVKPDDGSGAAKPDEGTVVAKPDERPDAGSGSAIAAVPGAGSAKPDEGSAKPDAGSGSAIAAKPGAGSAKTIRRPPPNNNTKRPPGGGSNKPPKWDPDELLPK